MNVELNGRRLTEEELGQLSYEQMVDVVIVREDGTRLRWGVCDEPYVDPQIGLVL
jgi:hypothetical protein